MIGAAYIIMRVGVVMSLLGGFFALLPDAGPPSTPLTIPDVFWNPLVGVLSLNRYFPIAAVLLIATVDIGIKAGMFAVFVGKWLIHTVAG